MGPEGAHLDQRWDPRGEDSTTYKDLEVGKKLLEKVVEDTGEEQVDVMPVQHRGPGALVGRRS
jgi:hypothetical protein